MDVSKFSAQMARYVPSFAGFTEFTPTIPKLYWNVKSQEQRILAICEMLDKVICYADMLGDNVDEIRGTLQDIIDGKLDDVILAAISQWFENHESEILADIKQHTTKKLVNVSNLDGVDNTGVMNSTIAIQSIIDNSNEGDTLLFEKGVYLIDQLNLKSNVVYDFNGSTIIYTQTTGMRLIGEHKQTIELSSDYVKGSKTAQLGDVSGIEIGDLVVIENQTEFENHQRAYYYKGFVSKVVAIDVLAAEITIETPCPYGIGAANGYCRVYSSVTGKIENIGNMYYYGPENLTLLDAAIYAMYGDSILIDNCKFEGKNASCINLDNCYNCTISNSNGIISEKYVYGQNAQYVFTVSYSTNTLVERCSGYNLWHVMTTGGHGSVLNTTVRDCVFSSSTQNAYADHDNAIFTTVVDCVINGGVLISPGGTIRNCVIYNGFENMYCITLRGHTQSNIDYDTFTITGVKAYADTKTHVIRVFSSPQIEVETQYFHNIVIRDCIFTAGDGDTISFNLTDGYRVSRLEIDVTNNLVIRNVSGSLGSLLYSNCSINLTTANYATYNQANTYNYYVNCFFNMSSIPESLNTLSIRLLEGSYSFFSNCSFNNIDTTYFDISNNVVIFASNCRSGRYSRRDNAIFKARSNINGGRAFIANCMISIMNFDLMPVLNIANSVINSPSQTTTIKSISFDGTLQNCIESSQLTTAQNYPTYSPLTPGSY